MTDRGQNLRIKKGFILQNGINLLEGGYNFTMEAPEKAEVSLLLYRKNARKPMKEIPLTEEYRQGRIRSVRVEGLEADSFEYNYRINGKVCPDPRARVFCGREKFGTPWNKDEHAFRCGLLPADDFDWEDETPPRIPYEDMILYKLQVRGYTKQMNTVTASKRGTFAGLVEMIPYWKGLGVNAIELMPCYEFQEVSKDTLPEGMVSLRNKENKVNCWGYISGYYFAPKRSFCAGTSPENEFRELIKALHREGMECIMEFYFPQGTNAVYALSAMQFWKLFYHVDGFHIQGDGFPIRMALEDGLLSETKMMAQDFDFQGFYGNEPPQVKSSAIVNRGFLEDMRRFLKSDEEMVGKAIYHMRHNSRNYGIVNYITSQDGFTLQDLVSYNYRHNEENGENNQDGSSYNYSWNCGVEGPTRKAQILKIRERQKKNAMLLLLLSQGTPMIYGGDEFGNSQKGNNNAWCQDNPTGWTDWKSEKKNEAFENFVRQAIAFRKEHPILHMKEELRGSDYLAKGTPDISLHGERAYYVSYDNTSRMFGIMYNESYACTENKEGDSREYLYIACNFHWENRQLALPNLPSGVCWRKVADTMEPETFLSEPVPVQEKNVFCGPRSVLILLGREEGK